MMTPAVAMMMPRATTMVTTTPTMMMKSYLDLVVMMSMGGNRPPVTAVTITKSTRFAPRMVRMAQAGVLIGVRLLIGQVEATTHQLPAVLVEEGVVPTCLEMFRGKDGGIQTDTRAVLMLISSHRYHHTGVLTLVVTVMLKERRTRNAVPVVVATELLVLAMMAALMMKFGHALATNGRGTHPMATAMLPAARAVLTILVHVKTGRRWLAATPTMMAGTMNNQLMTTMG